MYILSLQSAISNHCACTTPMLPCLIHLYTCSTGIITKTFITDEYFFCKPQSATSPHLNQTRVLAVNKNAFLSFASMWTSESGRNTVNSSCEKTVIYRPTKGRFASYVKSTPCSSQNASWTTKKHQSINTLGEILINKSFIHFLLDMFVNSTVSWVSVEF